MTKETVKGLQDAKGKFELEVNGFGVNLKADHCNGAAWIIAIHGLIDRLSSQTGVPKKALLGMIEELIDNSKTFECESKEQLDVINELYKQDLK